MKLTGLLPVALAAAVAVGCNNPQTKTDVAGTTGDETIVSAGDRDFVEDMTVAGMAEVELGKLAKERGTSPEVKQFADMMVTDHTKAGSELKPIAQRYGIPMPSQLDEQHRDLQAKLAAMRGAEFDREYMKAMVQGHQDVIDRLQARTEEHKFGDDKGQVEPEPNDNSLEAALNLWAARVQPTAEHHLDEAKRIDEALDTNRQTRR
jgi:putative membrane protein